MKPAAKSLDKKSQPSRPPRPAKPRSQPRPPRRTVSLSSQEQIDTPPAPDDVLHMTDLAGRVCGSTTSRRLSSTAQGKEKLRERVREIHAAFRWYRATRRLGFYTQQLKALEDRDWVPDCDRPSHDKKYFLDHVKDARHTIKLRVQRYGLRRLKSVCGMYCFDKTCPDSYLRGQLALVRLITATVLQDDAIDAT